jgi:hypothetical protein
MRIRHALITLILFLSTTAWTQAAQRMEIQIPDIPNYKTLKCDFHMHTVFSDGEVWPTTRVDEAHREGLDAIAITDHVEYHPHKKDVVCALNRPYEIALPRAEKLGLLLVPAAEITRSPLDGHYNCLFLKDAEPLDTPYLKDALKKANDQGAFVFWDHPGWEVKDGNYFLDSHKEIIKDKLIQGIETANGDDYYEEGLKRGLEFGLVLLGNSDWHDPFEPPTEKREKHRNVTLVFARERTNDSLKEAIVQGRTAVWHSDRLIGRPEYLQPLFNASVRVEKVETLSDNQVNVTLQNTSIVPCRLVQTENGEKKTIEIPGCGKAEVKMSLKKGEKGSLRGTVENYIVAPGKGLDVTLEIPAGN